MNSVDFAAGISLQPTRLGVVTTLLNKLHAHDIPYCHWKSNEHVREGTEGLTDLDVLVDSRRSLHLQKILADAGFKRFSASQSSSYHAVEDYMGFDEEQGKLVHLHLHYQLVVGEKHLKGYCLPWVDELLASREFDAEHGLYITNPNMEMLLLLLRSALKIRLRDQLLSMFRKAYFRGSSRVEYDWLQKRIDREGLKRLAERLLGQEASCSLDRLLDDLPTLKALTRFRRAAAPTLQLYQTYSPLVARCLRLVREGFWVLGAANRKYLHYPWSLRRSVPTGGIVVAILGSDGSGKSTLLKAINEWLSWKLDVYPVYHGSGDGRSSLLRLPLLLLLKATKRIKRQRMANLSTGATEVDQARQKLLSPARAIWALVLSREKRAKLLGAWRARHRGMIVVADRYPQNQVMGFNDGPRLSYWRDHASSLLRALARWESVPYEWAEMYPPDLIIKLHVEPKVAYQRKPDPDMSLEEISRRVEVVASLQFLKAKTLVVDANEPHDKVLLNVKKAIWDML